MDFGANAETLIELILYIGPLKDRSMHSQEDGFCMEQLWSRIGRDKWPKNFVTKPRCIEGFCRKFMDDIEPNWMLSAFPDFVLASQLYLGIRRDIAHALCVNFPSRPAPITPKQACQAIRFARQGSIQPWKWVKW